MNKWMLSLLAACLCLSWGAAQDAPTAADRAVVDTQRQGKAVQPSRKARRLAREFEVEPAEVQALRDRNMGWGEIRQALSISQRSGKPVSEIVELRDSGMGWGEISARYELSPGNVEPNREQQTLESQPRPPNEPTPTETPTTP